MLMVVIMSKLLIDEPPLQVLPSLAVRIGLCEAMLIQQIHYWSQRVRPLDDGYCWIYNTVKEWQKQFPFWSENTIFRHLQNLRESGVLIAEQKSPNSFDKTMYYRINYEKLDLESIPPKWGNRKPQNDALSNTETTRDYFSEFWSAYPKKVAKEDAISAWRKIKLDDVIFSKIIKAIKDQKLSENDKKFIPNPATWLNKKRWEDEVTTTQKPLMGWK
jgi:hypothetical protein